MRPTAEIAEIAVLVLVAAACGERRPIEHPVLRTLDAQAIAKERPPLAVAGLVLHHQVAIKMPSRSDVMVGSMRFPTATTFELEAATPLGMSLFTVGFDGTGYRAEVAAPLQGRFPAEGLARDIHRLYFTACGPDATLVDSAKTYVLECTLEAALDVREELELHRLITLERRLIDPSGRLTTIEYRDYRDHEGLLHPDLIVMRTEGFEIKIALAALDRP